ncbi:MAG TPA: polysaccharide pyruvyl transferase family protein [Gammaproteobacteria bacterium]|nr:polysaccharide pyruvyl transferase family protein [Gammaproteobacteria bacterium]
MSTTIKTRNHTESTISAEKKACHILASLIPDNKNLHDHPKHIKKDYHLVAGDDLFENSRPKLINRHFLSTLKQLKQNDAKTILISQTVSDYEQGLKFKILCNRLKNISTIIVKDQKSYQLLQDKGITQTQLSFDIRFLLEPSTFALMEAYQSVQSCQPSLNKCCLITLPNSNHQHNKSHSNTTKNILSACQQVINMGLSPIILFHPSEQAHLITSQDIKDKLPGVCFIDTTRHNPLITDYDFLQALLHVSKYKITSTYLSTIFAVTTGFKPLTFYASELEHDLIKRLKLPHNSICERRSPTLDERSLTEPQKVDINLIRQHICTAFQLSEPLH